MKFSNPTRPKLFSIAPLNAYIHRMYVCIHTADTQTAHPHKHTTHTPSKRCIKPMYPMHDARLQQQKKKRGEMQNAKCTSLCLGPFWDLRDNVFFFSFCGSAVPLDCLFPLYCFTALHGPCQTAPLYGGSPGTHPGADVNKGP